MAEEYDILVVGGGINGAGIARDAAGRGMSVLLVEQGDLASGTSSKSTKMIHGGLRYLEYYEFSLVRQALKEREVLLHIAPHLISPLRIVIPVQSGMRPAWLIRMGLWLYDHLGGKTTLPLTETVNLKTDPRGHGLQAMASKGFAYSDGWVDDSRLVVLNARDAKTRGAEICTHTKFLHAEPQSDRWSCTISAPDGERTISARCVINAAGPWADRVDAMGGQDHASHMVKVQGSHILLPKLYDGRHAYLLQNPDGRVLFAISYHGLGTLFGTTDTPVDGDPSNAELTQNETDYLIQTANAHFRTQVSADDIRWKYSGVRALFGDPDKKASALSRDYHLVMNDAGSPPWLSILGGKVTTYRSLAEKAVNMVCSRRNRECPTWTAHSPLPGGDLDKGGIKGLQAGMAQNWPFLDAATIDRLSRAYGTDIFKMFTGHMTPEDFGTEFAPGFYEAEAKWMVEQEFAHTTDDMLWRRSKLGLFMSDEQVAKLEKWLQSRASKA